MGETAMNRGPAAETRRYVRRWARNAVDLPAQVEVLVGSRTWTTGTAIVRDVSLRGARLGRLKLRKASLPIRPFRLRLTFKSGRYRGVGAVCRPVRFVPGPAFELAVEFEDFWASAEQL
jgi:hypothetical protein